MSHIMLNKHLNVKLSAFYKCLKFVFILTSCTNAYNCSQNIQ